MTMFLVLFFFLKIIFMVTKDQCVRASHSSDRLEEQIKVKTVTNNRTN